MYILRAQSDDTTFYITENKNFTIGRKGCDFLITNDTSVSKRHAEITLQSGILKVTDVGSKFRTTINNVKIDPHEPAVLKHGDTIRFGLLTSFYNVEEKQLVVLCSGLNGVQKSKLRKHLEAVNGKLMQQWDKTLTHLVVDKLVLTQKVIQAIIQGLPIVSADFFEKYQGNMDLRIAPPNESDYLCLNSTLKRSHLAYNPARKKLFEGKVFVFKTKSCLEEVIAECGGKCLFYDENKIDKDLFIENPNYLLIQSHDYNPNLNNPYNRLITYIKERKKRPIPQQEIPLAIIKCNCEMNCNPDFDRVGNLVKESQTMVLTQPLVGETEYKSDKPIDQTVQIVSETPLVEIIDLETDFIDKDEKMSVDKKDIVLSTRSSIDNGYNSKHDDEKVQIIAETALEEIIDLDKDSITVTKNVDVDQKDISKRKTQPGNKCIQIVPETPLELITDDDLIIESESMVTDINIKKETSVINNKRPTKSPLNENPKRKKIENIFTSTQNDEIDASISFDSVSQIAKRRFSDIENDIDKKPEKEIKKKRLIVNPFSKRKPVEVDTPPSSLTKNIKTEQGIPVIDGASRKTLPIKTSNAITSNATTSNPTTYKDSGFNDRSTVRDKIEKDIMFKTRTPQIPSSDKSKDNDKTADDDNFERNQKEILWKTINESNGDRKVIKDPEEAALDSLMASFKDCVVVEKANLVVERNYSALGFCVDETLGRPKNFKRFRKAAPLHPQRSIITTYRTFICGN